MKLPTVEDKGGVRSGGELRWRSYTGEFGQGGGGVRLGLRTGEIAGRRGEEYDRGRGGGGV
uniref:DUF834 domain-containing protein n=1 Tax=Oryza brachyantha TaxID=4533 RepID=J3NCY5_ORYBR